MAPTQESRRFPFPLPRGWYQIGYPEEFAADELRSMHYFGRDLIAFRGELGDVCVLEAHCPHLGAHLGCGGRIESGRVRCPFHGWLFDQAGRCVEVPYARRTPPRAKLASWHCIERNGLVMVWYHPDGAPPQWDVPVFPEFGSPGWTPWWQHRMRVHTCNQEIIENIADRAHFHFVHSTVDVPETSFEMDGPTLRGRQETRLQTPRGKVNGAIDSTYWGLGFGTTRFTGICEALMALGLTPVSQEELDVRFSLSLDASTGASAEHGVGHALISDIIKQFVEDTPIWENKQFQHEPVLCDGDGPIAQYRRWASQFYRTV